MNATYARGVQALCGADPNPATAPVLSPSSPPTTTMKPESTAQIIYGVAGMAAVGALAYHGYKRDDSVGGALLWGLLGGLVWPITLPIAFAQGFGKRK